MDFKHPSGRSRVLPVADIMCDNGFLAVQVALRSTGCFTQVFYGCCWVLIGSQFRVLILVRNNPQRQRQHPEPAKRERERDGCSTVVLICFTCPAITVATVMLRALDRVRERALGCFARSLGRSIDRSIYRLIDKQSKIKHRFILHTRGRGQML